jgi:hypothetical protein
VTISGRVSLVLRLVVWVAEDVVHDGGAAPDRGPDDVPVDGLGDVGRLVADRVADVLDRDAVTAHDRDRGVASLVGVSVADAGLPGHLAEAPVEGVYAVH